jgi:hypothetical protein
MLVYHYSEDPTIVEFAPRISRLGEPLVWAVDAERAPLYLLPRDCPRVTFWPVPTTTEADLERWWASVAGRIVVAIEVGWLERLRACRLYRYSFDAPSFEPLQHDAWMWVSRTTVRPVAVEPVGDLLERQAECGVELRLCQSLVPLGRAVWESTLHTSMIRMRNAAGWEEG